MNIMHNLGTVITALLAVLGGISSIISIANYMNKLKSFSMKEILKNPYKRVLFSSVFLTCICVLLFYIFGGFDVSTINHKQLISSRTNASPKAIKPTLDTQKRASEPIRMKAAKKQDGFLKPKKQKDTTYSAKNLVTAPNYGNQQVGDNNTMSITSDIFKKPTEVVQNQLNRNLKSLVEKYAQHPFVSIEIEYETMRGRVATSLSNNLVNYKIGYYDPSNEMNRGFTEPVLIRANSFNKQFVIDFVTSINPYFTSEYNYEYSNDYPLNMVKFIIAGKPTFDQNGRITIN